MSDSRCHVDDVFVLIVWGDKFYMWVHMIDDRHESPEAAPHGFQRGAAQFLFGIGGVALITFAANRLHLQPGSISLLYLIVVVLVSLRTGFVRSVLTSFKWLWCKFKVKPESVCPVVQF
jgi:hypothetical protein